MEVVIKSEHWVWYYVVSKNGVKLGPDELVVKNKQLPGIDELRKWLNGAQNLGIELRYFIDEDTADNDLRRYKKQLSKIVDIADPVITNDNISGFQKTVPQLLEQRVSDNVIDNSTSHLSSVKHVNHGGKRPGAGRPRGPKSQVEKDKIAHSMKGNQNAAKNTDAAQ